MPKEYIGDGVYVDYDGFVLILTTENGISVQNTVVLEPLAWNALQDYVNRLNGSDSKSNKEELKENNE